jgi:hypothetical protein
MNIWTEVRSGLTIAVLLLVTTTACGGCDPKTAETTGSIVTTATGPTPAPSCCTPPPTSTPTAIVLPPGPITLTDPSDGSLFEVKLGTVITLVVNVPADSDVTGPESLNPAVVVRTSHVLTGDRITGTFRTVAEGRADLLTETDPTCGSTRPSERWLVSLVVVR